jgi:hypothetical protein
MKLQIKIRVSLAAAGSSARAICGDAGRKGAFKHAPEDIVVMEPFIANTRECRVIGSLSSMLMSQNQQ